VFTFFQDQLYEVFCKLKPRYSILQPHVQEKYDPLILASTEEVMFDHLSTLQDLRRTGMVFLSLFKLKPESIAVFLFFLHSPG
jgi:hypothetical protein